MNMANNLFSPPWAESPLNPKNQQLVGVSGGLDEEMTRLITESAEEAYRAESRSSGIEVSEIPFSRRCRQVTTSMLDALRDRGLDPEVNNRAGWTVDEHRYPILRIAGIEVVTDPTWLQFVSPQRRNGLPTVLIGDRGNAVEQARRSGIDELEIQLWMPVSSNPQPERPVSVQERIARAYDAAMPPSAR